MDQGGSIYQKWFTFLQDIFGLWINSIIFELELLNAIYTLDAPKMLEIVKGHWNNSESTHNYFQDFMKWISILLIQNRRNKIENRNNLN